MKEKVTSFTTNQWEKVDEKILNFENWFLDHSD